MATHIHVETAATDCDGPVYRTYVVWCPDGSEDYEFWANHVKSMTYAYADSGELRITSGDDFRRAQWWETTDEGSCHVSATLCRDECEDESTYRDVRAEQAGY